MLPPTPVTFSTTTVWPRRWPSCSASSLAITSVVPPAANGTTIDTERVALQGAWARPIAGKDSIPASTARLANSVGAGIT
jgi:hypothetical protein